MSVFVYIIIFFFELFSKDKFSGMVFTGLLKSFLITVHKCLKELFTKLCKAVTVQVSAHIIKS